MPDGGTGREGVTGHPETSEPGRKFGARRQRGFPVLNWGFSAGGFFSGRGFLGRPALIALAVAVPMAEAAAVDVTAPSARAPSPAVTALASLAAFQDLR